MPELWIPAQVEKALLLLAKGEYEAYVVGGCVRDSLLGKTPEDWDITTSALPEETKRVFSGYRQADAGIRHGTVLVVVDGMPLEITTYRVESGYSDHRHPDNVRFTTRLREDLSRRDFTINAMAYHPDGGLVDFFDGQMDLKAGLVRCVGDPSARFQEDALRILRALRFAAVLDFSLDEATAGALLENRRLLQNVTAERISVEFQKLLCGPGAGKVLREYAPVIGEVIPELLPLAGFDQHSRYHLYDVYEHTLRVVESIEPTPVLRLAALLHDVAKPLCYEPGNDGRGHFYGHAPLGAQMAGEILNRLRVDRKTADRVFTLIRLHDATIEEGAKSVKHWLNKLGGEALRHLLLLKKADILAQAPDLTGRVEAVERLQKQMEDILREQQCFSLKDLAVKGGDLLEAGMFPGKRMGEALHALLEAVINGECANDKTALLEYGERRRIL